MADSPSPGSASAGGAGPPEEPRVAEVLQQLRSGVRQRSAELAVLGGVGGSGGAGGGGEATQQARQGLAAVRAREYVQEPIAFSHRRRLGRFVVLSRKVFFHLFLKWFQRPVIEQQNAFNQAAAKLMQELVEAQDRTARELRRLAARVERMEAGRGAAPSIAERAPGMAAGRGDAPSIPERSPGGEGGEKGEPA